MPSIISMPVASRHSTRVAAGSTSPADTHLRKVPPCAAAMRSLRATSAIARYEVGAVNMTVAPSSRVARARSAGAAFSSSTVEAPMLIGNSVRPPKPNVKASGGLPMKTSSARRAARAGEADAGRHHVAMKCIVAFGTPVVPEVNASRQVSSAAVSTASNGLS